MIRPFLGLTAVVLSLIVLGADSHPSREQVRLRAHFDSVLVELRTRDVTALTVSQRASRERLIKWLADYRDAGLFPVNDRYADVPTPIFRDARGVTCAMAYLVDRSGRGDIVDRISSTRNLAYIRDLTDDTVLVAWLDSAGLTAGEAARIQPTYPGDRERRLRELRGLTVWMSGTSLLTAGWNIAKPSNRVGVVGVLVGGLTALLWGPGLASEQEEDRTYSTINVVSGGIAILSGVYAIRKPRTPSLEQPLSDRHGIDWVPFLDIAPTTRTTRLGFAARF